MTPLVCLLPSPYLGAVAWEPVAAELRTLGWSVICPEVTGPIRTPEDVSTSYLTALPVDRELVLVPHSNAGLFVPVLASQRRVVGSVFVDAALTPEQGFVSLAPADLRHLMAQRADEDGLLPPWTRWWESDDVAALFPDAETRERIEGAQPRLPLSYLTSSLPVPAGWAELSCAYLAFGDTYDDERRRAIRHGWEVSTLSGRHLHLLVDPPAVARAIAELLETAGLSAAGPT